MIARTVGFILEFAVLSLVGVAAAIGTFGALGIVLYIAFRFL